MELYFGYPTLIRRGEAVEGWSELMKSQLNLEEKGSASTWFTGDIGIAGVFDPQAPPQYRSVD